MKSKVALISCLLILGASCAPSVGPNVSNEDAQAKLFTLKVLPLLKSKCFGCHGNDPDNLQGDYDLRTRQSALKGGESGSPAIVAGKPGASPLLEAIKWEGLEMPPKENDRLNEQQIEIVRQWIQSGAAWPSQERQTEIKKQLWSSADGIS